jgi:hypothetical protein
MSSAAILSLRHCIGRAAKALRHPANTTRRLRIPTWRSMSAVHCRASTWPDKIAPRLAESRTPVAEAQSTWFMVHPTSLHKRTPDRRAVCRSGGRQAGLLELASSHLRHVCRRTGLVQARSGPRGPAISFRFSGPLQRSRRQHAHRPGSRAPHCAPAAFAIRASETRAASSR